MPFVAVAPVDSLDEALKLANDTEYGLTAGMYSEDQGEVARPPREGRVLLERRAGPALAAAVRGRQLGQREGLADALTELVGDELDLLDEAPVAPGIRALGLERAVAVVPLLPDQGQRLGRHRRRL